MIRRISAVLIGLALTLPLTVSVVTAHSSGLVVATVIDVWTDAGGDTHVIGTVTNHRTSRVQNVQITATWTAPAAVASGAAFITSLAPHASSPFHLVETDDTVGSPTISVSAVSNATNAAGGLALDVEGADLVGNVYTISVTNESTVVANDVRVYAVLTGTNADAAASANPNQDLNVGETEVFTVTFDAEAIGTAVAHVIAQTTSGAYGSSWNNFFNDLYQTNFMTEIAWMADEGITLGCGGSNFCPTANVTRGQMAVFLDRALELPATVNDYFTDDEGHFAEASINRLRAANITTGCTATTFCPNGSVTREQMAAFLDRGYDFPTTVEDFFTDDETSFAEDEINDLANTGVTTGCTATTFCPKSNVTRGQMAAFIYRAEHLPS